MKLGVISDVHGNSTALKTVLDDMPPVDQLVSLGDVVGYGPHPRECVELVQEHCDISLYGNHESFLADPGMCRGNDDAHAGIMHARNHLTGEQRNWAADRPWRDRIDNIAFAHGHPDPETPFKYVRKNNVTDLIPRLRATEYDMLAVGHSHVQFKQDLKKFHDEAGLVFNPGSVGQPRDGDPRAAYAVADLTERTVDLHRVEYDVASVIEAINEAGLPDASGERLKHGKYPRSRRY